MKKAYLLIALACVTVYSCTKHTTTYNNSTVDNSDTTGFVVRGIADMELESRDSIMIPIGVEWVSGPERKLTFSASGLPDSVKATFSPESGYNFGTTLKIVTKKAALGSSDIKIMVSDSTGVLRTYTVKLTVMPKMQCMEEIIGSYMGDYMCTSDTDSVSSFIFASGSGSGSNKVSITNLVPGFSAPVDATLTCEGQKLNIPSQSTGPFIVWGDGNFSVDSMVMVNYSYYDGVDTINCIMNLKKQP